MGWAAQQKECLDSKKDMEKFKNCTYKRATLEDLLVKFLASRNEKPGGALLGGLTSPALLEVILVASIIGVRRVLSRTPRNNIHRAGGSLAVTETRWNLI